MNHQEDKTIKFLPIKWGEDFSAKVMKIGTERAWLRKIISRLSIGTFIVLLVLSVRYLFQNGGDQAWNVQHLLSPGAIIFSVVTVVYLTLLQLDNKEKRDRIEHAVDVCERAPDLTEVDRAMAALQNHLEDAFSHYQTDQDNCCNKEKVDSKGEWEKSLLILKCLANKNPKLLAKLIGQFANDHGDDLAHIAKVMAFFEKSAIGIELGHADDEVVWKRFNVAAVKCWLKGYCFILHAWGRHSQSKYLNGATELGLPYEHYEAWLRHHCHDDSNLTDLLDELHNVRSLMISALSK